MRKENGYNFFLCKCKASTGRVVNRENTIDNFDFIRQYGIPAFEV